MSSKATRYDSETEEIIDLQFHNNSGHLLGRAHKNKEGVWIVTDNDGLNKRQREELYACAHLPFPQPTC